MLKCKQQTSINVEILALLYNPPPPLFDLKLVYSYVIEIADSESKFDMHGKALVSEILLFIRIKVTYISSNKINMYLQLNDFFALLFEEIAKCMSLLFK